MSKFLNKGMLILIGISIIIACSKDDGPTVEPETPKITNVSFTVEASGDGNVITVTPSSTGGTSYSIDFGTAASDDVLTTAGPGVSYTYPEEDASYTIVVTASATGYESTEASQNVTIDYVEPDPSPAEGRWVLLHEAGALAVGPSADDFSWWSNMLADVATRDCLFDDVYVFNADGTFQNEIGDQTWLEPNFGTDPEACDSAVAPWDGSASATWSHNVEENTITITGAGAYLGLFKIGDSVEYADSSATPDESITYTNVTFSEDGNTMTVLKVIADGSVFWQFKFAKEGTPGASIPQTDTDGDGVIDIDDVCPTVAGTLPNGCPVVAAPEDAPTAPSVSASNVISIFSDAYTDIPTTWAPNWGQSTIYSEEIIAGNSVKKLTNFNFVGIDNVGGDAANRVSISDVTTVTFDYWTPDGTTLKLKLVDYLADGDWDGATNIEQIVDATTAATTGSWVNVQISMSDFNSLSADGKIGQIIFDGGDGTQTFFIDNVYFY